jgi:ADP-heptose:LPS heptosyltransferase
LRNPPMEIRTYAEERDFSDTSAMLENMDLLISVDTSVAHLAGALGRPAWVLLSVGADWRWLEKREDSPWYPTVRLFRQTKWREWSTVVERVAEELAHLRPG